MSADFLSLSTATTLAAVSEVIDTFSRSGLSAPGKRLVKIL
jgi:hypothetical protein